MKYILIKNSIDYYAFTLNLAFIKVLNVETKSNNYFKHGKSNHLL